MFDFNKPKLRLQKFPMIKNSKRFVVEPLERGYGITLGNS